MDGNIQTVPDLTNIIYSPYNLFPPIMFNVTNPVPSSTVITIEWTLINAPTPGGATPNRMYYTAQGVAQSLPTTVSSRVEHR